MRDYQTTNRWDPKEAWSVPQDIPEGADRLGQDKITLLHCIERLHKINASLGELYGVASNCADALDGPVPSTSGEIKGSPGGSIIDRLTCAMEETDARINAIYSALRRCSDAVGR